MGSTNKTAVLDLSQFIGTDKPTWLGDYNGDMGKIETAYATIKTASDNAAAAATAATTTATNAANQATATQNELELTSASLKNGVHVDLLKNGCVGDGVTDDTAAINAAIASAIALGINRVFVPDRVFIVSGNGDLLTASTGIELYGPGTIKVKNGNGAWSSMFTTGTADASGLYVHGITWDGNATNNQPLATDFVGGSYAPATRRIMIRADHGAGIRVQDNTFRDHDGEWVFISANDASDVKVRNNRFLKIGNLTNSSLAHDSSAVYIDATGYEISGNVFSAYDAGLVTGSIAYGAVSAIDTHGPGGNIHHNLIIGFLFGAQISTSPYRATIGVEYHHNVVIDAGHGFHVVPYAQGMTDVNIHHNHHELNWLKFKDHPWSQGGCGFDMFSTNGGECDGVTISDNVFRWVSGAHTGTSKLGAGFLAPGGRWNRGETGHTAWDRNLKISGNLFVGAPDVGLFVKPSNVDGLEITDNVFEDVCSTANGDFNYSVALLADYYTTVSRVKVDRNSIRDNQTPSYSPYGNTAPTITAGMSLWYTSGYDVVCQDNRVSAATSWVKMLRELDKCQLDPAPIRLSGDYMPEHSARSAVATVQDTAYFVPIKLGPGAITQAATEIVTAAAGSSVECAIYSNTVGRPGKKLADLGTIDSTQTSWRATAATVVPLRGGIYWLALCAHGGTPTLRFGNGRNSLIGGPAFTGVTSTDLTAITLAGQASLPAVAPAAGLSYGAGPVFYVVGA